MHARMWRLLSGVPVGAGGAAVLSEIDKHKAQLCDAATNTTVDNALGRFFYYGCNDMASVLDCALNLPRSSRFRRGCAGCIFARSGHVLLLIVLSRRVLHQSRRRDTAPWHTHNARGTQPSAGHVAIVVLGAVECWAEHSCAESSKVIQR